MTKHYAFGEITVTDFDWVRAYLAGVNAFIEKHGGKVLARTLDMTKVEGERAPPTNVILVEFPSKEAATAFFEDPDYQPLRATRLAGSISEMTLFPAEDLALAR